MNHLKDSANDLLTDGAPSAERGPLGSETPRVARPEPEAANPPAGAAGAPTAEPRAPTAARTAPAAEAGAPADPPAPERVPGVFCANCNVHVDPAGKGLCPVCGRFLPENVVALVTGLRSKKLTKVINEYRAALLEQLFAERGGRDVLNVVSRLQLENFALLSAQAKTIEERLDKDGLFTQTGRRRSAFDMLKAISETIDRLRAQLPPVRTRPATLRLDDVPLSALEASRALLTRVRDGETLTEREQGQLDILRRATHGEIALPPDPPAPQRDTPTRVTDAGFDAAFREEILHAPVVPREPAPVAPVATCQYCRRPVSDCAQRRSENADAWRASHRHHPDEEQRRADLKTKEMVESMRRRSSW